MKRSIIAAFCCLLLMSMLLLPMSETEAKAQTAFTGLASETTEIVQSFHLPASLEKIGDEAFEGVWAYNTNSGISAENPDADVYGKNTSRIIVWIPASVRYIGKNAFPDAETVQIVGSQGSYAHSWAKEHGYRFVEERIVSAQTSQILLIIKSVLCFVPLFCILPPETGEYRKATYRLNESIGRDPKGWPGRRVLELDYP